MTKHFKLFTVCFLVMLASSCKKNEKTSETAIVTETKTDANDFSYESVTNDPTGLRLYTLDNGLKVYLSQNNDEPKVQTFIGVRAGSNYDPAESTGLAHYLDHQVFKGTSNLGNADWEKE